MTALGLARTDAAARRRPAPIEELVRWTYQDQRAAEVIARGAGLDPIEARAGGIQIQTRSNVAVVERFVELGCFVDGSAAAFGASTDLHPDAQAVHEAVTALPRRQAVLLMLHGRLDSRPDWMPHAFTERRARPLKVETDLAQWRKHLPARLPEPAGKGRRALVEIAAPAPWRGGLWAVPAALLPVDNYRRLTCGWSIWTPIVFEPSPGRVLGARRLWRDWADALAALRGALDGRLAGHALTEQLPAREPWDPVEHRYWQLLEAHLKKNPVDKGLLHGA